MEKLSDLEHIRQRLAMYVGNSGSEGLHHIFAELLDNAIDQYLAKQATFVRAEVNDSCLEVSDDGPGLPFDEQHESGQSLASFYLTEIRRHTPTADGHSPHVHINGGGCGLRLVSALTRSCEVLSWRKGNLWRQTFSQGELDTPAHVVRSDYAERGTHFRLSVDRDMFPEANWLRPLIDIELSNAAYLFPGLRVESPTLNLQANRGLAEMAETHATKLKAQHCDRVCWVNGWFGDIHVQAALAGQTTGDTFWCAYANGSDNVVKGTHLTALKRVAAAYKLKPTVAMIHVIMRNPRFAGPTRNHLDVPEIFSPIYQALKPEIKKYSQSIPC